MYFRKLLFIFLLLILGNMVSAATFTVTSNADSGPGTLRQALTDAAANGTATIDYINFNLPGLTQADITITVQTQLPDVTANVVIDGSTQPTAALGVSGAKVIVTVATPAPNLNAFWISGSVTATDAVEFYGLYIKGFSPASSGNGKGIVSNANCKLVIGAPGKGNVISGNWYAILGFVGGAKIQSNLIGVQPDGVTLFENFTNIFTSTDYDNLLIGGDTPSQGNVIEGGYEQGITFGGVVSNPVSKTVIVKNNLFGTDYTGNVQLQTQYNAYLQSADASTSLQVLNNVFAAGHLGINFTTSGTLVVKGNFFGTNKTQTVQLGSAGEAIHIVTGVVATIGGNAAADQNVFAHYANPIFADNDSQMLIVKNKFFCNDYVSVGNLVGDSYVRITNLTTTSVSGDAKPGALVQLYYADAPNCTNCNPTTWFANVTANTAGKWIYNGNTTPNILASSTVNNNTFGFQHFLVLPADVTVTNIDCHHPGSIEVNENRTGRVQFVWRSQNTGQIVGTGRTVTNLSAGDYNLEINESGTCVLETGQFSIIDLTPHTYSQDFQLNCGSPTGSLTAVYDTGPGITVDKIYWENAAGAVISNAQQIDGLTAGDYYLYIKDSNGCTSAKVKCRVLPPVGQPVIVSNNVTITNANCDFADGAVKGMMLQNAASANYGWVNQATLASYPMVLDLVNVPPGQYYFYVNYSFTCDQLKSQIYMVTGINAITLNETGAAITPSTCSNSNGGIKGITATGATHYQWYKSDNTPIGGNAADLLNVPAGDYHLIASNSGCSKTSHTYTVSNTPANDSYPSTLAGSNAYCGLPNGSLAITFTGAAPASYRWQTPAGVRLVSNASLTAAAGNYQLYVTDANGCESLYGTYVISDTPALQIVAGNEQHIDDQCSTGTGGIKNVIVMGGVAPYTYVWTNASQSVVRTSADLLNVPAGDYTLVVKDAISCDIATHTFTVADEKSEMPVPEADNVQVCGAGDVIIKVNNPQSGYSYRLYGSQPDGAALGDNAAGVFHLTVSGSMSVYVTQYNGECESQRKEVKIIVSATSVNIPNTFTPNNDGRNDLWNLTGIENYPKATVRVFNRYGQKVFESRGYAQPFDGRQGAADLPIGVYYYIIDLSANCTLLSGSLTILR